jgi:LysR family glycine cleavage system transcriptional activator
MNWLKLPPLHALRAFSALAEQRSYVRAGQELNVTHAAVIQQVKALEAHVGHKLVTRSGRGVELTPEGRALADDLAAGFGLIQRGVQRLRSETKARPVQVTTSPAFAVKWLMPRLSSFHQANPDITLMLNPTGQIVRLEDSELDVAIRYGYFGELPQDADILIETDLVVVAAPQLVSEEKPEHPKDLLDFPWLQELGTNEVADWFRRRDVRIDRPPMISHMPGNLIMDAVAAGDGVTYTCRQWIERELSAGELVELFADERCGVFHIVQAEKDPREPVRRFVNWLRRQVPQGSGSVR